MNLNLRWILVYSIYVFCQENSKPPGTTFVAGKNNSESVTAIVNGEALKDPENYELVPLDPPVNKNKPKKSFESFAKDAKKDGLVEISSLTFFGNPKELLNTPTPVLIAAQKLLEDSVAPGNPQTIQAFTDKGDSEEEAEETDKDKEKNKEQTKAGNKEDKDAKEPSTKEEPKN